MTCPLGKPNPDCNSCPYSKENWEMQVSPEGIDWKEKKLCDWPYIVVVKAV